MISIVYEAGWEAKGLKSAKKRKNYNVFFLFSYALCPGASGRIKRGLLKEKMGLAKAFFFLWGAFVGGKSESEKDRRKKEKL